MTRLSIENLSVQLRGRSILSNINLCIAGGEMVGLLGPNGAGKTTLIKALAGLLPIIGTVYIDGRPLCDFTSFERARCIAYIPQSNSSEFYWPICVRDVIALGRLPYKRTRGYRYAPNRDSDDIVIRAALSATATESLAECSLVDLSGGERARVLLARALAVEAIILLADEPVTHLDPRHQLHVLSLLRLQARSGVSVVVILHDLTLATRFCERVVVLNSGCVVASGPPAEVLDDRLLAQIYGIRVVRGEIQGKQFLLPWEVF